MSIPVRKFPREYLKSSFVKPTDQTEITLLGSDQRFKWNDEKEVLGIEVPSDILLDLPFQYADIVKITNAD